MVHGVLPSIAVMKSLILVTIIGFLSAEPVILPPTVPQPKGLLRSYLDSWLVEGVDGLTGGVISGGLEAFPLR